MKYFRRNFEKWHVSQKNSKKYLGIRCDPIIIDMNKRIRAAILVEALYVEIPKSALVQDLALKLKKTGYIDSFSENYFSNEDNVIGRAITFRLRYRILDGKKVPALNDIRMISKPSRRFFFSLKNIPVVLDKLGIAILRRNVSGLPLRPRFIVIRNDYPLFLVTDNKVYWMDSGSKI